VIIYGKNPIVECIKNSHHIFKIYLLSGFKDTNFLEFIKKASKIEFVESGKLETLSNHGVHQGVVAEIQDYSYSTFYDLDYAKELRLIVLDEITDPRNLGAIIRSAVAFNFDAVVIPNSNSSLITSVCVKTSAGLIEYIKVIKSDSILKDLASLKKKNFHLVAADLTPSSVKLDDAKNEGNIALIMGSEGKGIRKLVLELCDEKVIIPMSSKAESLNVAVASAILMYKYKKL
jgi:23S rRNA (guanosine2251-2'-O)-methyltransferase